MKQHFFTQLYSNTDDYVSTQRGLKLQELMNCVLQYFFTKNNQLLFFYKGFPFLKVFYFLISKMSQDNFVSNDMLLHYKIPTSKLSSSTTQWDKNGKIPCQQNISFGQLVSLSNRDIITFSLLCMYLCIGLYMCKYVSSIYIMVYVQRENAKKMSHLKTFLTRPADSSFRLKKRMRKL